MIPPQGVLDFADRDRRDANPIRWQATQVSPPLIAGSTYNAQQDEVRFSGQMLAVYGCISDQQLRTLAEIRAIICCGSEASISARLRDFRKNKWGGNTVNRRRGEAALGLHESQLLVNPARRFAAESTR